MGKPGSGRSYVIGTAGHIDHGKTSLVNALTGVDTDRLSEEKRRGITIELGFAPWKLASGAIVSIVDVPGHEGFVRTMVAGAGGIDLVLLVVSAEDGVMPQTREHIHVCSLLGVKRGVVALTKIDRLEDDAGEGEEHDEAAVAEAIELASVDVQEALDDTVFADAPIVPCSAVTGAGLDALRSAVRRLLKTLPGRPTADLPILPIDRAFVIKGHGTVVTGTLLTGTMRASDPLTLVPVGARREPRPLRVRSVQVRGDETGRSRAGTRTALNLASIATHELRRGDVITLGDRVARSDVLHAAVEHLPHDPHAWSSRTSVELCAGTAHCTARLDPLIRDGDGDETTGAIEIAPGQSGVVRLRLDVPIPAWAGMRVILRGFHDASASGPQRVHGYTLGGGVVLDPMPSSGRGQRPRWRALATQLRHGSAEDRALALLEDAGALGISRAELTLRAGLVDAALDEALAPLLAGPRPTAVTLPNNRYVTEAVLPPLTRRAIELVDQFHEAQPVQPGMSRAAVERSIPGRVAPEVVAIAIDRAVTDESLYPVGDQGLLARPGKGPDAGYAPSVQRVLDQYAGAGIEPPTVKQVEAATGLPSRRVIEALSLLQKAGALVRVTHELSMARESHEQLVDRVRAHLGARGELDVQALKAMTGLSRKFVVPLLEHFDRIGVTRREGDRRVPGPRA